MLGRRGVYLVVLWRQSVTQLFCCHSQGKFILPPGCQYRQESWCMSSLCIVSCLRLEGNMVRWMHWMKTCIYTRALLIRSTVKKFMVADASFGVLREYSGLCGRRDVWFHSRSIFFGVHATVSFCYGALNFPQCFVCKFCSHFWNTILGKHECDWKK